MKTISSLFVLCCVLLCCLFTLSNCGQEPSCDDVKTYKLVNLSSYVPYTGNDTLRFLRNSTDTQIFVGQGLERFYVSGGKNSNADCPEDHESVSIRFLNSKSQKEIKIEFVYDRADFNVGGSYPNSYTFYKFYFNGTRYGTRLPSINIPFYNIEANGMTYSYVNLFEHPTKSSSYFAFRRPIDKTFSGLIKIITLDNDTFEVIQ